MPLGALKKVLSKRTALGTLDRCCAINPWHDQGRHYLKSGSGKQSFVCPPASSRSSRSSLIYTPVGDPGRFASLPIEAALAAVAEQADKQHVKGLIMAIRSKVLEGYSLAVSLGDHTGSFDSLYRATVSAGEQSGFLDKVLENLSGLRRTAICRDS